MITPEILPFRARRRPELAGACIAPVGCSYRDLVLPVSGDELRDLTEPPRCGVMQYPDEYLDR